MVEIVITNADMIKRTKGKENLTLEKTGDDSFIGISTPNIVYYDLPVPIDIVRRFQLDNRFVAKKVTIEFEEGDQ